MTAQVVRSAAPAADLQVDVLVIGAGACGCCAALAAAERGASVLIAERDRTPSGSTSLSGGQIPAAGTALQRAARIDDTADILAEDLIKKAKGQNDEALARHIAAQSAVTVDWLVSSHTTCRSALSRISAIPDIRRLTCMQRHPWTGLNC